jgi:hypothetical protein
MSARRRPVLLAAIATAMLAPAAEAAGPPVPSPYTDRIGVSAPGGTERIVLRRAGGRTEIRALQGKRVVRSGRIAGRWSIAAVTMDGATTGLSADGKTLVLSQPARAYPPTATRLAVIDAQRLTVRREIALKGFFNVDAISPDGRTLVLLHYPTRDIFQYRVRALDTATGALAAQDITDKRNPGEQMGGLPVTRTTSRDGRWFYTLYSGGSESFIHALDTVGRTAACIDLEMLEGDRDFSRIRLGLAGDGTLNVSDRGKRVAIVDTRSFAVREPGDPLPEPVAVPWKGLLLGAAATFFLAA